MEAAVAHAPPAPALRRSLALSPTPAVRPDPKPWQGVVLSARRQSNAVRCEPSRRPETRLRLRLRAAAAAQPGAADAAAAGRKKRLAVFVSGGGIQLPGHPRGRAGRGRARGCRCGGAEYARSNGIPVLVFPKSKSAPEGISVAQLLDSLRGYSVDFVLLAGYLKLIPTELIQEYPKSILNIHPSLLPAFGGKGFYGSKVHTAVIASGARYSGPTVHFVDEHYDTGKTLAQRVVPVFADDTPELLAARVLHEEHQVYVEAVAALCEDRIVWREDGVPLIKSRINPDVYL
uniref:phosphoribosylglycinamide formyltransferase 1 n=1 Tax=Saccharum hybrid cultivar R570 TaxID=131158 RepID=A0A059PZ70_9POAL|nr:phosphoribosylglycinamide formyltransferase [Saccharum hybrid cultivar R570]